MRYHEETIQNAASSVHLAVAHADLVESSWNRARIGACEFLITVALAMTEPAEKAERDRLHPRAELHRDERAHLIVRRFAEAGFMTPLGGIIVGATLTASAAMGSEQPRIEVFTTARHPIATTDLPSVEVYHLDAPAALEAKLSARLPRDREAAAQLASAEIQGTWRKSAETLTHAYQGLLKARQYSLQKLPAVVFEGQAVVYGVTGLEQALGDYRRWEARQP